MYSDSQKMNHQEYKFIMDANIFLNNNVFNMTRDTFTKCIFKILDKYVNSVNLFLSMIHYHLLFPMQSEFLHDEHTLYLMKVLSYLQDNYKHFVSELYRYDEIDEDEKKLILMQICDLLEKIKYYNMLTSFDDTDCIYININYVNGLPPSVPESLHYLILHYNKFTTPPSEDWFVFKYRSMKRKIASRKHNVLKRLNLISI